MQARKIKYSTNLLLLVIIMFAILVVINFISSKKFSRLDLTQDKEFTISESTKKVLRNLDDIVTIKAYFSKELPSYLINLDSQIKDILSEYKAYAKGNLNISYTDPGDDEKLQNELRFMGIPQVQLQVVNKDKAEVMKAYLGIAVMYGDKKEALPVVQSTETLEYDLTSAIVKVTNPKESKVGFLTGNEEKTLDKDYSEIKKEIEKQYTVSTPETKKGIKIPTDIDTLIIASPKNVTERDKYEIDQFLMEGGKVIFMIDSIAREESGLQANPSASNLDDLLLNYGVRLNQNLVLDRSHANAAFSSGFIRYSLPYPFWVKIVKEFLDASNPIVSSLESLVFPWVCSVEIVQDKAQGLKVTELVKTSPYAWSETAPYDLNPQQTFSKAQTNQNQYTLAVALSGTFKSFYKDKAIPKPDVAKSETGEQPTPPDDSKRVTIAECKKPTQIVVVGNSEFADDHFLSQFPSNGIFFLNMIDWLTLGDQLINIRTRGMMDRPLKETTDKEKARIKFLNIYGVSILVILFGILKYILRKNKKRRLQHAV
jgi:ABC-2 type transport system permease protein